MDTSIDGTTNKGDGLTTAKEVGKEGEVSSPQFQSPSISPPSSSSANPEDLTARALRFLSTASAEAICGIAVALAACTYLILGRIGLVLIGALGGIVLHATWEGQNQSYVPGTTGDLRREQTLDIVKRLLDLREDSQKDGDSGQELSSFETGFEGFQPETTAALNEFVDAVIKNYVKWWYSPILPNDQSFPAATRQLLTKFMLSLSNHLSRKRPADTFLDFLTNSSSIVIVFLNELTTALSTAQSPRVVEAVHTYLAENPESNLANVLNPKQQSTKFKMVAEDILQNFLDKSTYECDPAKVFLREMLAEVVLEMTLTNCSKPEWINGWIVYLLEEGEPNLSQAIDAGMGTANGFTDHSFDANGDYIGSTGVTKQEKMHVAKQEERKHRKRLSKAEEAMEEAMEEAKRLSQLIAEADARKLQSPPVLLGVLSTPNPVTTEPKKAPPPVSKPLDKVISLEPAFTEPFAQPPNTLYQDTSVPEEQSPLSGAKSVAPAPTPAVSSFTNFDQIVPQSIPIALQGDSPTPRRKTVSLTLHNANIIIYDDSTPVDKGKLRSKPNGDYLVQIEPASSQHPGWMIVRKYADFETLHEVLRRIAQISGVTAFAEQHHLLPNWKEHTKASLRGELERYLRDACWYQQLAESEGMKRFLEKDQGQGGSSGQKTGFSGLGWPAPSAFENMGKGVLDVLANAPKGVAEGGKAIGGGISGVLTNIGNLGQKKTVTNGTSSTVGMQSPSRSSVTLARMDSTSSLSGSRRSRASEDSLRATPIITTQPQKLPTMERRPSYNSVTEEENERQPRSSSARSSMSGRRSTTQSRDPSRAPSRKNTPLSSPIQDTIEEIHLPPPPSEMGDNYSQHDDSSTIQSRTGSNAIGRTSTSVPPSQQSPGRSSLSVPRTSSFPVTQSSPRKIKKDFTPLTEQETRVAVELLFAVINELYTLSSAWNIRRTLLTAAKAFLLRPGNPSLSSIQSLIQDSVIASNTSDAGIAFHLRKLRANTMPTEEESRAWPPEMTSVEKERLRLKARKLLVERGMPTALTGVMGQAASSEAMGRVFDLLQEDDVARGLIFALLLQAVRAITH